VGSLPFVFLAPPAFGGMPYAVCLGRAYAGCLVCGAVVKLLSNRSPAGFAGRLPDCLGTTCDQVVDDLWMTWGQLCWSCNNYMWRTYVRVTTTYSDATSILSSGQAVPRIPHLLGVSELAGHPKRHGDNVLERLKSGIMHP
jgi:hypothetical protein